MKNLKTWWSVVVLSSCVIGISATNAQAQLVKIKVGYPALNMTQGMGWIAKEAGLFQKYGLDADVVFLRAGPINPAAMLAGDIQFSLATGSLLEASVQGADIVAIANLLPTMLYYLMVKPGIRSVEDLRGKIIGVARFGSATDRITRKVLLDHWRLVAGKDYSLIQMGSDREILGGLLQDTITGGMLAPPGVFVAQEQGLKTLVDIPSLKVPYTFSGVTTRKSFIDTKPEIVHAFMKAYVEAIAVFHQNREFSLGVMGKYLGQQSPEILRKSYDLVVKYTSKAPYPDIEGVKTFLEQISDRTPKGTEISARKLIDPRFVKELEQSGFVRDLYRGQK